MPRWCISNSDFSQIEVNDALTPILNVSEFAITRNSGDGIDSNMIVSSILNDQLPSQNSIYLEAQVSVWQLTLERNHLSF